MQIMTTAAGQMSSTAKPDQNMIPPSPMDLWPRRLCHTGAPRVFQSSKREGFSSTMVSMAS
jgi:hypothetical protein